MFPKREKFSYHHHHHHHPGRLNFQPSSETEMQCQLPPTPFSIDKCYRCVASKFPDSQRTSSSAVVNLFALFSLNNLAFPSKTALKLQNSRLLMSNSFF